MFKEQQTRGMGCVFLSARLRLVGTALIHVDSNINLSLKRNVINEYCSLCLTMNCVRFAWLSNVVNTEVLIIHRSLEPVVIFILAKLKHYYSAGI